MFPSKAACAAPLCETTSLRRGRRPHHAWKAFVGTGGPTGSAGLVAGGGWRRGMPEPIRAEVGSRIGIVPMTPSKETSAPREGPTRGGPGEKARVRTQSRVAATQPRTGERGGRRVASRPGSPPCCITSTSRRSNGRSGDSERQASAGVDGMTVADYEQNLARNLQDLCARVHTGRYRPQPVRRVYIPKADGGQRPLGVPTLEDKIVQGAVAEVLSAIYEVDFLGFSYGFRPGRNPHQALAALHTAIMSQRVNWVLDADIRSFFDSVDHEWLLRMLAHRIADPRILRLIGVARAGILESDEWHETIEGTPQGAGISPLLANIFLHYVLDLWVHQWRRRARGRVSIVRYADDFVMGFENEDRCAADAGDLKERLAKFGLALHEDKTRLIEFGRFAGRSTRRRRAASGDLRLSRLHPLLRVDPGRPVHRQAQDAEQAPDAQAEGAAPGGVAADARAAGRAARMVSACCEVTTATSACRTTGALSQLPTGKCVGLAALSETA